ncbi:MAG: TonB family protein [Xanthomonadales bacterium]|nr:TonB family protein [Xanthomonadales bacterium]
MPELQQIQPLVNALGWTLIHFLWQGACIAGLYWMVCRFTRPEQSSLRYWTGMSGFLASVLVPLATFFHYLPGAAQQLQAAPLTGGAVALGTAIRPTYGSLLQLGMEPAMPFVVAIWAVGVVLLSLRALLGWMGARRMVTHGTEPVGPELRRVVYALMRRLGIRQWVTVLSSTRVKVPTVVGWLNPVILLPVSVIAGLPRAQLEMIIAHELGHIRRYDYLLNLLQLIIETLFFYHPAIRWLSRQVRQEREHCCDDLVVARCEQPAVYARALANLETLRSPVASVAMAATGGDLVHRVRRIVRRELPRNHAGFTQLALLLGVAMVVSVSARQGFELSRQVIDKPATTATLYDDRASLGLRDKSAWLDGLEHFAGLSAMLQSARNKRSQAMAAQAERERARRQRAKAAVESATEAPSVTPLAQGVSDETSERVSDESSARMPAHDRLAERMLAANSAIQGVHENDPNERARRERQSAIDELTITPETVVAPVYPFKARRQRLEGHVRLEFSVDDSGRAKDISVVDAYPPEIFEESAVRALEKWVFEVDGSLASGARVYQDFDFNMEDDGTALSKRERRCEIAGSRICGTQRWSR